MIAAGIVALAVTTACGTGEETTTSEAPVGSSEQAVTIGSSNVDYQFAANEYSTFTLGVGGKYVAFGSGSKWTYKSLPAGTYTCNVATFGTDPAPGVTKTCYFANLGFVANEEYGSNACSAPNICVSLALWGSPSQPTTYAFGANGNFRFATFTDSNYRKCSVTTFGGDPAPGVGKACYRILQGYQYVSSETNDTTLTGLNNTPVAFGANGKYVFAMKSGSSACNVATFGDPIPGVVKSCYIVNSGTSYVTSEGNSFYFNPDRVTCPMSYTSGRNGNVEQVTNCSGTCNNSFFGGDPDPGYTKYCYGAPVYLIP